MAASRGDAGKMAVVLDTGAVSRGSGNQGANKERDIRKRFVEDDLGEAVFLLPENLFYNTTAPGIILVLNRRKRHPGEVLLVNGSKQFSKGRPKNYLQEADVAALADTYLCWKAADALSAIIRSPEAAKNDYNLSPNRYIAIGEQAAVLALDEAVVELREAEEELVGADRELKRVLRLMGLDE
jgi:type I restriction enzyme M protein